MLAGPINREFQFGSMRNRQFEKNTMKTLIGIFSGILCFTVVHAEEKKVDFAKEIQPILSENCIKCHGPEKQKGKLRLDSREAALKGGTDGEVLIPGAADK